MLALLSTFVVVIICTALATFVAQRAWDHRPSRMFVWVIAWLVLLNIISPLRLWSDTPAAGYFLASLVVFGVGVMSGLMLLFLSALFVPSWWQGTRPIRWIILPYVVCTVAVALDMLLGTGWFVQGAALDDQGIYRIQFVQPAAAVLRFLHLISWLVSLGVLVVAFLRDRQSRIVSGMIFAALVSASAFAIVSLDYPHLITFSPAVITLPFIASAGYAVLRTRLLTPMNVALDMALQSTSEAVTVLNTDGTIVYANPPAEALGLHPGATLPETLRRAGASQRDVLLLTDHNNGNSSAVARTLTLAGRKITINCTPVITKQGRRVGDLLLGRDVTDLEQRTEQLAHERERLAAIAHRDALTGLPNRASFLKHLAWEMHQQHPHAVLFIDLDNFKIINDSMGHLAGDRFLVTFARHLQSVLPTDSTVARFGGDEFLVLLTDIHTTRAAVEVAEHVLAVLDAPLVFDEHEVAVSVSIGVALAEHNRIKPDDLLRNANMAMYHAKQRGRAQVMVYDQTMHDRARDRLRIETELRRAIEQDELRLYYQPVIELASGKVVGFEALVRWQHPERGLLSPGEFIPIAEESGLIVRLDRWVMQRACRQVATWLTRQNGRRPVSIRVNVSGHEFLRPGLTERVTAALHDNGLDARHLQVEITETVAMDNAETTVATLDRLRLLGVQVLLDDFGTGYSSLRYLQRFPVQSLKIDASFVKTMEENPESAAIVQVVISLAHTLGLDVVAEGIETRQQSERVQAMGCRYGQGAWFSMPVDAEAATEMVLEGCVDM